MKMLLVEDEADAAAFVAAQFPNADVLHVESVAEALEQLDGIDVVLLDLGLPDSAGFETLAQLLARAPQVPVVVLTGNEDPAIGPQALEAGAQDFVLKEDVQGLSARVEAAIVRQRHRNHAVAQAMSVSLEDAEISDDILEAFAVVDEPGKIAKGIKARYGDVLDRVTCPYLAGGAAQKALLEELRKD